MVPFGPTFRLEPAQSESSGLEGDDVSPAARFQNLDRRKRFGKKTPRRRRCGPGARVCLQVSKDRLVIFSAYLNLAALGQGTEENFFGEDIADFFHDQTP